MDMQYRNLGRTGLSVSRICLGTMNFGPHTPEDESHRVMDRARELGINFFDTANVYGRQVSHGLTEEIIGRWFAQGDGRREETVIATKVYGKMGEGENHSRLSARHIREAVEESLTRLQTDYIDLYQMHHVDRSTPWEEIWQAFDRLVAEGKILYVGSSNFAGWHIAAANEAASRRNSLGLVSEQSLYNLAARTVELEVLPACEGYGLGLIPWSPLMGGLLGGALAKVEEGRRASEHVRKNIEKHRPALEKYEDFCREIEAAPAVVALAWLLKNPVVTAPIIGPRTLKQLEESLEPLALQLTEEHLQALDEIWPGPGGPAPEAYAW